MPDLQSHMTEVRQALLEGWDRSRELNRNDLIRAVREHGGVMPIPGFIDSSPGSFELLSQFAMVMISTLEHVQACSVASRYMILIDVPERMFTFARLEDVEMLIEVQAIDNDRLALRMPS